MNAELKAVLGPTNTGKTHLAVERMCGHSSGMIGFPLRLLAREVYDRVVKLKGANADVVFVYEYRQRTRSSRQLLEIPVAALAPPKRLWQAGKIMASLRKRAGYANRRTALHVER